MSQLIQFLPHQIEVLSHHLRRHRLPTPGLAARRARRGAARRLFGLFFILGLVLIVVLSRMPIRRHPAVAVALERLILVGQVDALLLAAARVAGLGAPALREIARARRQLAGHDGLRVGPVGEGVLAILDNAVCRVLV